MALCDDINVNDEDDGGIRLYLFYDCISCIRYSDKKPTKNYVPTRKHMIHLSFIHLFCLQEIIISNLTPEVSLPTNTLTYLAT